MLANAPARELLPALRIGEPLVLALRAPDVIDAIRRVAAGGEAETALWSERVPIERLFQVDVAPLATDARRCRRDAADACAISPKRAASSACAPISSPTPATNCARRSPRCSASSKPCKARRRPTPRRARKFLAIMREQGRRMARLIDDLLSLSRIEQKQHRAPGGGGRSRADRAPCRRHAGAAGAGNGRRTEARRRGAGDRGRRARRTGARGREPDRERHQIRRARGRRAPRRSRSR